MKSNDYMAGRMPRGLTQFYRDEGGVATIFACFIIMMMLLVGGIGVDLMHNEMERTRLQNTLDRAVLAAADLDQTLDPESVVNDYFDKAGMADYLSDVTVSQGLNFRTVNANAATVSPTQFMRLMGVDELNVPAASTAEERISNVEISMVLDISGSMQWNSKIDNLRDAANAFSTALIKEETQDLISISVIPYSEHVNAGAAIFNALPNKIVRHGFSHCVEFPDTAFTSAALDTSHTFDQMQHFQWYYSSNNSVDNTTCPRRSYEEIQPLSQNLNDLQNQINQLQPRAQTSIFLGVKWAAALLDPSSRGIVDNLINGGHVDATFSGRPADYSDPETLKTIVVMTDGNNTDSHRISNAAYRTSSHYRHWRDWNFWYYLDNYEYSSRHYLYYNLKYTGAMGDTLLSSVCKASRDAGIVIWGVGFEVDDHGADVLKDCASSPSHFFRVEGVEITEAFKAIATQINQLRLTQ